MSILFNCESANAEIRGISVARALLVMCGALGKRINLDAGHSDWRFITKVLNDGRQTEGKTFHNWKGPRQGSLKHPRIAVSVVQHICR